MTARARAFLGKRKLTSPVAFDRHVRRELVEWQEFRIRTALGMEFRHTSRVMIVQPRWMPAPLYRWLMRTIVIEAQDLKAR